MAEVLSPETQPHFTTATLRRSTPSSSYLVGSSKPYAGYSNAYTGRHYSKSVSTDSSSCPPSLHGSHADLHAASSVSTPSTSFSADSSDGEDRELIFPSYGVDDSASEQSDDMGYILRSNTKSNEDPSDHDHETTPTNTPDNTLISEDDTAVRERPTRHVDYLSHEWAEEDIWASWKHLKTQRQVYGQQARLENASWRTWGKQLFELRTIPPEKLNWLKDVDVTWLYGPLQTSRQPSEHPGTLSKSNSFLNKKPILKKRSMSEVMLQKSLSSSSLVKAAVASVKAQEDMTEARARSRPVFSSRAASDFVPSAVHSQPLSREPVDLFPSSSHSTSGLVTPGDGEKRHIRFDEKVEQCIAVDPKDLDEEDDEAGGEQVDEDGFAIQDSDSSSSDEGVVMMKRSDRKRPLSRSDSRSSFTGESRTIAMLPAATLKSRNDTPDIHELPSHSVGPARWQNTRPSPSPSQETLRPSDPSTNYILDDYLGSGRAEEEEIEWEPSSAFTKRVDSLEQLERQLFRSELDPTQNSGGMRRTSSGMFMPFEENAGETANRGLFSTVIDGVNTARDIAHVIWNVGWRSGND